MKNKQLYFLAIVPPPGIESEIIALKEYMMNNYDSRAALRSPPHITLFMPFQYNEDREEELIFQLSQFSENIEPFETELKDFDVFPPRVIFIDVVRNQALNSLQKRLTTWMKKEVKIQIRDNPDRPFHPHVTIAFRDLKKARYFTAWEEFQEKTVFYKFLVAGYYLLKHDGKVWQKFKYFEFNPQN